MTIKYSKSLFVGGVVAGLGQKTNVFERYQILEQLGEGGFGQVLKGIQTNTNQLVAIKKLKEGSPPDHAERFRREMELLAQLPNHPHLVNLIDSGESEGELFIVLEFIEGTDLSVLLKQESALSPSLTRRIIIQALEALQVVHDAGIVHRDLKPANIMLTGSKKRPLVKLLDFGIATKQTNEGVLGYSPLTQTGMLVGTRAYLAPELAEFEATPRSDIFAMGIILLQCLTGKRALASFDLEPSLLPYIKVFERACFRDPGARFQSASAMIEALEDIRHEDSSIYPIVDVMPLDGGVPESSDHIAQNTSSLHQRAEIGPRHSERIPIGFAAKPNHTAEPDASPTEPEVHVERRSLWPLAFGLPVLILLGAIGFRFMGSAPDAKQEPTPSQPEISRETTVAPESVVENVSKERIEDPADAEPVNVQNDVDDSALEESVFQITTTPTNAIISVEGKRLGKSPFKLVRRSDALPVEIELSLDGYERRLVHLNRNSKPNLEFSLEPKARSAKPAEVSKPVIQKPEEGTRAEPRPEPRTRPKEKEQGKDSNEVDIESFIPD